MLELSPESGRFQFRFSSLSSYLAMGTYTLEGDVLTLNTDDNALHYTFRKSGDAFVFDAAASSEIPSYRYEENGKVTCPVPDGAVFTAGKAVASETVGVNLELLSDIGKTYSELSSEYGAVNDVFPESGGPVYSFENSSCYYSFSGYQGVDWGYELAPMEGFPKPPTDEKGHWILETAPLPKTDAVCTSLGYARLKDVFLGLDAIVTPEALASAYGVTLSSKGPRNYRLTDHGVLFRLDEYRFFIGTDSDYLLSPEMYIQLIKQEP